MKNRLTLLAFTLLAMMSISAKDIKIGDVKFQINNDGTATLAEAKKAVDFVIPETVSDPKSGESYRVTAISNKAFKGNKSLKSVKFNGQIDEIPDGSFSWCKELTTVDLTGVKKIGSSAFERTNISELTIPASVTDFGRGVLSDSPVETVIFAESEEPVNVFNLDFVKKVVFNRPFNVTIPNTSLFFGSWKPTESITLGANINNPPADLFQDFKGIKEITILSQEFFDSFDPVAYIPSRNVMLYGPDGVPNTPYGLKEDRARQEAWKKELAQNRAEIQSKIDQYAAAKDVNSLYELAEKYIEKDDYSDLAWVSIAKIEDFYKNLSPKEYVANYDEFSGPNSKQYALPLIHTAGVCSKIDEKEGTMKSIEILDLGLKLKPGDPIMLTSVMLTYCDLGMYEEGAKLFPVAWRNRVIKSHAYDVTNLLDGYANLLIANGYNVERPTTTKKQTQKEADAWAADIYTASKMLWNNRQEKKRKQKAEDEMLEYLDKKMQEKHEREKKKARR